MRDNAFYHRSRAMLIIDGSPYCAGDEAVAYLLKVACFVKRLAAVLDSHTACASRRQSIPIGSCNDCLEPSP